MTFTKGTIMKRIIAYIIIFLFANLAQSTLANSADKTVIIINVNDIHSQIDNFSRLKSLADSLEKENPNVLILGAGDYFSGNPIVDFYDPKGLPMIELMNKTGFDLVCFGNHEFDYNQKSLQFLRLRSNFPYISANIIVSDTNTSLKAIQGQYTFNIDGLKLTVIGALQVNSNGMPSSSPDKLSGIKFEEPFVAIGKELANVTDKPNALIALTHLGYSTDSLLALKYPKFNLIIGGHTHTLLLEPKTVNGVTITQTNGNMKYAGIVKLHFTNDSLTNITDEMFDLARIKPNPEIQNLIDAYNDDPVLNTKIAHTNKAITKPYEIGLLICDALKSKYKTDFALQNYGGMRIDRIDTGAIRTKDILSLLPFGNTVNVINTTVGELKDILKKAWETEEFSPSIISGGKAEITIMDNAVLEIKIKDKSGKELKDNKKITLALNDYAAKVYAGDLKGKKTEYKAKVSDILSEYLKKNKKLNYSGKKSVLIFEKD
jgi:5'-nucleotidase / UDP-sugar diphosphatase